MTRPSLNTGTSTVTSSSWPAVLYGSFVISTSPGANESGGYSSRIAAARERERVDVAGRAGHRLRHHPGPAVEHGVGEVAGLPDDRAEGGPLQRLGLLVDRGDQALPQHLELDGVERAAGHGAILPRVATSEPSVPTSTDQPGRMTAVVSRSSTMAGPSKRAPAPERVAAVDRDVLHGAGPGEAGLPVAVGDRGAARGQVGHRLDRLLGRVRRQPPRHRLHADVRDGQAVDALVLLVEAPRRRTPPSPATRRPRPPRR